MWFLQEISWSYLVIGYKVNLRKVKWVPQRQRVRRPCPQQSPFSPLPGHTCQHSSQDTRQPSTVLIRHTTSRQSRRVLSCHRQSPNTRLRLEKSIGTETISVAPKLTGSSEKRFEIEEALMLYWNVNTNWDMNHSLLHVSQFNWTSKFINNTSSTAY